MGTQRSSWDAGDAARGSSDTFPASVAAPFEPDLTLDSYRQRSGNEPSEAQAAIDEDTDYEAGTERIYLSGRGFSDPVIWDFKVDAGRTSNVWSKIGVPSNWEFYGFGTYRYGIVRSTGEVGHYRTTFTAPESWKGKRVKLMFEGSMTDTAVELNGKSAGPLHQGAFYRFGYEVTDLIQSGGPNLLEVTVAKESANDSVNDAERRADYWVFGGIYRPVYLELLPEQFIERIAANPKADGSLTVDVFLDGLTEPGEVHATLYDADMVAVGESFSKPVAAGDETVQLETHFEHIVPWNAERPVRYRLAVTLETETGARHELRENIGFRTVEVRPGDGIYINDQRVVLRGINRHSFWPNSGRALSKELSLYDVRLLKSMNFNAVRSSHYPTDKHFLDLCDKLGLYVLDELAGWQAAYDTDVGYPLVKEMVQFNVNHPSILFWDNGNEGGWNVSLDRDFGTWDPQGRPVLHPQATRSGLNTVHYRSYSVASNILQGDTLFMPTEFLHGLYDGGHGAGLDDYWNLIYQSPLGAGAFLWAFLDEGALRTDTGKVDVQGNKAADGIVGPYREREGSYYSVRHILAPVQLDGDPLEGDFNGGLTVENRYDFTNLSELTFNWRLLEFHPEQAKDEASPLAEGTAQTDSIAPGESGALQLALPADWADAEILTVEAHGKDGHLISNWSWSLKDRAERASELLTTGGETPTIDEGADAVTVTAGAAVYTFDSSTGALAAVKNDGNSFSFTGGPNPTSGEATLTSFSATSDEEGALLVATYEGALDQVLWRINANGWLSLTYRYTVSDAVDYFGVSFDYPENQVDSVRWLGRGPYRVWKNRMRGPWHDVFRRDANDAVPGSDWNYPEFKGYFADLHWASLFTSEGPIHIVVEAKDIFLRLFTPRNGPGPQTTASVFPEQDISFLHGIAAQGTKLKAGEDLGPQGAQHQLDQESFEATLHFYFGEVETFSTQ